MQKSISVSEFYKSKFGGKVYKLTVDAGCTCPTRDGTLATGGCIFCSQNGSGDFTPEKNLTITEQIEKAKLLVDSKFSRKAARGEPVEKKYIVYFQNFTNTYGNPQNLIAKYKEAIGCEKVVGIAIGTRPDCINKEVLDFLAGIADSTFVQLELGFQTSNEKSAEYIRRYYKNDVYLDAVQKIHKANKNIHIVTHVIFGLPGETSQDMMNSVDYVIKAGTDGIKIVCLYVLKGTDLEKEYFYQKFKVLEMEEYFDLIKLALVRIPQQVIIHRLTGDGPKNLLIAPMWTADKKKVLNELNKILK